MRYHVNEPTVISETIGGEAIIVNLSTGSYYSLDGTAVEIWEGVLKGERSTAIVSDLASHYDAAPAELEAAVGGLLDELVREQLVVPVTRADDAPVADEVPEPVASNGARKPFSPPGLHKFTDMQDIILLDPVHEVDDRGWPHVAPERSTQSAA